MAINFFAQFRICQRVVPMMIAQGGGRIVNVSGETGIMTLNPPFLSSCTGTGEIGRDPVLQGSRQRACAAQHPRQLRDTGFHQHAGAVCKMGTRNGQAKAQSRGSGTRASVWSSNQGMRNTRWGTPEEIANLIVFAVSDAASYINGAELVADNAMDKS